MIKFSDLKLDPKVLKAIAEAGYDKPTPIQAGAIPPALEGRDVLGIAQTGTGKTASFTLPVITLLGRGRARARMPRSLVLAPTRELAAQVAENFDVYAKHTRLTKALLIGGVSFAEQDKLIDRGVDVLIATPGRLLDHFERGKLLLTGVQIMVVDEADRMLDMGFIPDIERIFQLTPFTRQTLFFSATMAPEIERITDTFLHSPERIEVARQATASETISQLLIEVTPTRKDQTAKHKREVLRAIINAEGDKLTNAMIFCNRKTDVDILSKSLRTHGYDAAPIHGDLDQSQRTRTLEDFRDGKLRFLVASDVAARGLDVPSVSHVFNFDLPSHAEDYVHRIGRTGRAGRKGAAISISTPLDEKYLTAIEGLLKQSLPRGEVPAGISSSASSSASAPDTQRTPSARGQRNGSGRDRRSNGQTRDHGPQNVQATPEKAPQPQKQHTAEPAPAAPERRGPARTAQPDTHNHDHQRDRRTGDRHQDRRRSGDNQRVMGMGDHVPDFMLRCFRPEMFANEAAVKSESQAATASVQPVEATDNQPKPKPVKPAPAMPEPVVEPQPVIAVPEVAKDQLDVSSDPVAVSDSAAEEAAPKKAPARRRTRAAAKPTMADVTPAEPATKDADTVPVADQTVAILADDTAIPEAEPAKPVRKRAPRPRKTPVAKSEEPTVPVTEAEAQPAPTKPATKKAAAKASDSDTTAETPVKPVRRRTPRKVAAVSADAPTDAPVADTPSPAADKPATDTAAD